MKNFNNYFFLSNLQSLAQFLELVPPTLTIGFVPVLAVLSTAILGLFVFKEFEQFNTLVNSVVTVTGLLLNQNLMKVLVEAYPISGPLYLTILFTVLNFIVVNFFISLLNEKYSRICTLQRLQKGNKVSVIDEINKWMHRPTRKKKIKTKQSFEKSDEDFIVEELD